jgi:hypothetical protein
VTTPKRREAAQNRGNNQIDIRKTIAPHESIYEGKDIQTQLSHQTKKYDLKSKHCGAQSDLGTTRAKVVEALTEVHRAKIDGPALIFDDQLCELRSSNTDASTSA